jgi:hypothetical protein
MLQTLLDLLGTSSPVTLVVHSPDGENSLRVTVNARELVARLTPSREEQRFEIASADVVALHRVLSRIVATRRFISVARVAPGLAPGAGRGGAR